MAMGREVKSAPRRFGCFGHGRLSSHGGGPIPRRSTDTSSGDVVESELATLLGCQQLAYMPQKKQPPPPQSRVDSIGHQHHLSAAYAP